MQLSLPLLSHFLQLHIKILACGYNTSDIIVAKEPINFNELCP